MYGSLSWSRLMSLNIVVHSALHLAPHRTVNKHFLKSDGKQNSPVRRDAETVSKKKPVLDKELPWVICSFWWERKLYSGNYKYNPKYGQWYIGVHDTYISHLQYDIWHECTAQNIYKGLFQQPSFPNLFTIYDLALTHNNMWCWSIKSVVMTFSPVSSQKLS